MDKIPDMPEKFPDVIRDFLADLTNTFPEYVYLWGCWQVPDADISQLYHYCLTVYPERFFDILYQNDEIFLPTCENNTMFLPNVEFKMLFSTPDISDHTKQALWKYLQLILVTIMGSIQTSASFGDTASLFEGIDEAELQQKLAETIGGLSDFFKGASTEDAPMNEEEFVKGFENSMPEMEKAFEQMFESMPPQQETGGESEEKENTFHFDKDSMPNVEDIHGHIKGLFDGKIGSLAKELAEEMSGDVMNMFDDGTGEVKSTSDILKKMMRNPKQIMELVKKIGSKLDAKMKSGNISQEEIMKEAGDLMSKMKGMGNGKDFQNMMQNMMKQMGPMMGAAGKGAKFDMGKMNNMMKENANKERMRTKLEQRKNQAQKTQQDYILEQSKNPNEYVFKVPEDGVQQKSAARPTAVPTAIAASINDDWLDEPLVQSKSAKNSKSKPKGKKGKK